MKLITLFEEDWTPKSVAKWIQDHWDDDAADHVMPILSHQVDIKDGKISISHDVYVLTDNEDLPFNIYEMSSGTALYLIGTRSLKGCPKTMMGGQLGVIDVRSFEGAPSVLGDRTGVSLYIDVESLHGIHEHFKEIMGFVSLGPTVRKNILGLLKIKGIRRIQGSNLGIEALEKAVKILNKHIGQGSSGMIKAQRELLENDLDDYAEL